MRAIKENIFTHMRTGDIRESATREVALELSLEVHVGVNQLERREGRMFQKEEE